MSLPAESPQPSSPAQLWRKALEQLRLQMTKATFDTWLRGTECFDWYENENGETWVVAVRHAYALDWLNSRLMPVITSTVEAIRGRPVEIRFDVRAPFSERPPEPESPEEPLGGSEPILEAVQEERVTVRADGSALMWTDFYIKLKLAFRRQALARLRGAKLSVFLCLALHVDRHGIASPGIDRICEETGYSSRSTVCSALEDLVRLRIVEKLSPAKWGTDRYRVLGYAWFGPAPAPSLFELEEDTPQTG
jgi:hypothetical protein